MKKYSIFDLAAFFSVEWTLSDQILSQNQEKIYLIPGKKLPMIMMNGYVYCINRRTQGRTFWLCRSYGKTKCTARVTTIGSKTAKVSHEHNHPPPSESRITEKTMFTVVEVIGKS